MQSKIIRARPKSLSIWHYEASVKSIFVAFLENTNFTERGKVKKKINLQEIFSNKQLS